MGTLSQARVSKIMVSSPSLFGMVTSWVTKSVRLLTVPYPS